jgi:hypothetical protein
MLVAGLEAEVEFSLTILAPEVPVATYVRGLLGALQGEATPALMMAFDRQTPSAELTMQGLRGLMEVPPVLYLDDRSVELLGHQRVATAPCAVEELPGGGLLLVAVPDPCGSDPASTAERLAAVREHLGIGLATPAVLVKPGA